MGERRRRWPWLLIAAGIALALYVAAAARTRWVRESFYASIRTRSDPEGVSSRVWGEIRQIQGAEQAGRLKEASDRLRSLFARPNLTNLDHEAATIASIGRRIREGRENESALEPFLDLSIHSDLLWLALEEAVAAKRSRGDSAGLLRLLERVVDGELRHPTWDVCPFPYPENWAAEGLVKEHLARGDGVRAFDWAWRLKFDYAVDYDSVCGMPKAGEMEDLENYLASSAALAGITYDKLPRDWAGRDRRIYGPSWGELIGLAVLGVLISLGGAWVASGEPFLRLFWARRGGVARACLAAAFLAGAAPQLWLMVVEGFPPGPAVSLGMALLAPAFVLPSIALFGCFLAKPRSSLIGLGAKSSAGIVKGRSTTSAAALSGRSRTKQGANALIRQHRLPSTP